MTRDHHKLSVVIPTIGRETLALCRTALAEQTRSPDEVIVVIDHHRQGAAKTRNEGIARATGDLIAFLDDDTIPPPDWLERLVAALDRYEAAATGGTFKETDPLLDAIRRRRRFPEQEQIDQGDWVGNGGNLLIRRQWVDVCLREDGYVFNPFFAGSGEDWELMWRLRKREARMVYVPVPVTHLRRVTIRSYLSHSFERGTGIARLFRLLRSDETRVIPQDSLLWGQAGKKAPPRWFAAVWSKLFGPFVSGQFQCKKHFWVFWLGEKAQAVGFAWGMFKERRAANRGSSTSDRRAVRIS